MNETELALLLRQGANYRRQVPNGTGNLLFSADFLHILLVILLARTAAGKIGDAKKLLRNLTSQTDRERILTELFRDLREETQISFEALVTLISLTNPALK